MMLNFEEELKKFKPIPNIDHIEEQIKMEDIRDIMDLIKMFTEDQDSHPSMKNHLSDKES